MVHRYLEGEEIYAKLRHLLSAIATGVQAATVSGTTITFTMIDGSTVTMEYPTIDPGTTITKFEPVGASIYLEQDDGTNFTCPIPGAGLVDVIDATTTVGGVNEGTHYPVGYDLEEVVRQILQGTSPPIATAKYNGITKMLRDATDSLDKLASVDLYAKGEWGGKSEISTLKGTYSWTPSGITPIKPAESAVLIDLTIDPAEESHEVASTPKIINPQAGGEPGTLKWKVDVTDVDGQSGSDTAIIEWILPKYWGLYQEGGSITEAMVDSLSLSSLTAETIKGYSKILEKGKAYTKSSINSGYGKIIYAFPKEYGTLSSVKDKNGFDCTGTYSVGTKTIDGFDYYVYLLADGANFSNATQIYA